MPERGENETPQPRLTYRLSYFEAPAAANRRLTYQLKWRHGDEEFDVDA